MADTDITPADLPTAGTAAVPRNKDGTLKKGAKLGKGRKKGSKNKATILREKMERKVSIRLSKAVPEIVDKVIEQSLKEGCRQSQKMILDRAVPIKKAEDGNEGAGRDTSVHIVISNLTRDNVAEVLAGATPTTIEGEYERED